MICIFPVSARRRLIPAYRRDQLLRDLLSGDEALIGFHVWLMSVHVVANENCHKVEAFHPDLGKTVRLDASADPPAAAGDLIGASF